MEPSKKDQSESLTVEEEFCTHIKKKETKLEITIKSILPEAEGISSKPTNEIEDGEIEDIVYGPPGASFAENETKDSSEKVLQKCC